MQLVQLFFVLFVVLVGWHFEAVGMLIWGEVEVPSIILPYLQWFNLDATTKLTLIRHPFRDEISDIVTITIKTENPGAIAFSHTFSPFLMVSSSIYLKPSHNEKFFNIREHTEYVLHHHSPH